MTNSPTPTVAYLINQYPGISHTFIRREILALESQGVRVVRYSVRQSRTGVVDELDRIEQDKTRVILSVGALGLLTAVLRALATRSVLTMKALALALRVGWGSQRGLFLHLIYWAEACVLTPWLEEEDVGHVHAHFGTNSTALAMLCRAMGGPSYSFTVHGPREFDDAYRLKLRDKISHASFVVAITEYCRSQLYRWCSHEHWSKIHVVRCGLGEEYLPTKPAPIDSASRTLTCVGRICEQKGQLRLVEAAGRLKQEGYDFELVLVGDGDMRGEVESLIGQYGLAQHVTITGWADGQKVKEMLLKSRAMVLPSFAEGLPVVIMEAMAMGRPVVTTYIAGIPELVEPNVSGWLVAAGSVDQTTEAMRQVLDAPVERLEAMGRAGAEQVEQKHDVIKEAKILVKLFGRRQDDTTEGRLDGAGSGHDRSGGYSEAASTEKTADTSAGQPANCGTRGCGCGSP